MQLLHLLMTTSQSLDTLEFNVLQTRKTLFTKLTTLKLISSSNLNIKIISKKKKKRKADQQLFFAVLSAHTTPFASFCSQKFSQGLPADYI